MNGTLGTVIVLIILLVIIVLIICSMVHDKRQGKSVICGVDCKSCGGCCSSCKGCPRAGNCHVPKDPGALKKSMEKA